VDLHPPLDSFNFDRQHATRSMIPRPFLPALLCLIPALVASIPAAKAAIDRPWNQDLIYFALTDRFFDGDPSNNRPPGSDPALYDPEQSDIDLYHGGDFRGLELALASGYFNELGVTAIWITPPVRNVWYTAFDSGDEPKTGYHGYWTQDFLDIDPHLVSRRSLDGSRSYPDNREGRMAHYRDLVALAHRKGIKIIQDIVCNHAGPVFHYDANRNRRFDRELKAEWIQPYVSEGYHANARWAETPAWNQARTEPAATRTIFGKEIGVNGALADLESYGRKGFSPFSLNQSDGTEVLCDFLSLRDFWTAPDSPHFDALVNDFVEIYAFYIEEIGVDGLRIDTVKHVHHEFWDAFTRRLRARLGPERASRVILFGEVYDGDPAALGAYTYRSDWPLEKSPSIDSLLNFQFCYAVREYLRTGDESTGSPEGIREAMRALSETPPPGRDRPYYNPTAGPDGLDAIDKIINFVENHDGINRFRVRGVSAERNRLANLLALTMPGIPCLYYGTEAALQDKEASVGEDAETGRMTFVPAGGEHFFEEAKAGADFQFIARLARLRHNLPALASREVIPLWADQPGHPEDDGSFVFARGNRETGFLVVAVNGSTQPSRTEAGDSLLELVDAADRPLLEGALRLRPLDPATGALSENRAALLPVSEPGESKGFAIELEPLSFRIFQVEAADR